MLSVFFFWTIGCECDICDDQIMHNCITNSCFHLILGRIFPVPVVLISSKLMFMECGHSALNKKKTQYTLYWAVRVDKIKTVDQIRSVDCRLANQRE